MRVTDSVVAALKAYLRGDTGTFDRLSSSFSAEEREASGMLITTSFFVAAENRFAGGDGSPAVVDFVSSLRARSDRLADSVDPGTAERLLRAVVTDESVDDIDDSVRADHYSLLLVGLVVDAQLTDAELDKLLAESSELAESLLQAG